VIYVTSDTHFNHKNILLYEPENRPFNDLSHMNETLIANWNAVVKPEDLVIHMGDVCMGPKENHAGFRARLNGTIWLVKGNHDRSDTFCLETLKMDKVFDSLMFVYKGVKFFCKHEPSEWDKEFDIGLCGHVHGEWKSNHDQKGRLLINCGVDVWGCKPVSLDTIIEYRYDSTTGA
jgi:calcineurin-like phosphoesterase family protein